MSYCCQKLHRISEEVAFIIDRRIENGKYVPIIDEINGITEIFEGCVGLGVSYGMHLVDSRRKVTSSAQKTTNAINRKITSLSLEILSGGAKKLLPAGLILSSIYIASKL
ncbi:MAG: hypothetical protein V4487_06485 [Chlamydiota bacterium]